MKNSVSRGAVISLATVAVMSLSACGGSSGGVVSTPAPPAAPTPPPAPTPPNTSLLSLTSSENFANDTASGAATFPVGPTSATTSLVSATVAYDLTTRGYTITVPGRSQTFLPGDIDAAQTTATITVYVKRNGTTTDSLTLTKAGTSGRFTFQYVGGGYWQRTNNVPGAISGSFEAFSYGLPTANASVPRTGRSEYAVDLVGVQTVTDNVIAITGSGTMQIDFVSGQVITHGVMDQVIGHEIFSSEAVLSSSSNAISGNFRLNSIDSWRGTLSGKLYGPAAQEVGAAFQTRDSTGQVAVGTLIGRGTGVTSVNTTVTAPTVREFFANNAATLSATLTGTSGFNVTGTFSATAAAVAPLAVNYDPSVQGYTVVTSDRSQYFGQDRVGGPVFFDQSRGTTTERLDFQSWPGRSGVSLPPIPNLSLLDGLQYVRAGRWTVAVGSNSSTRYTLTDFTYGVRTAASAVPRTGRGGFVMGIRGTATDADFPNLMNLVGSGTMIADFTAGTMTGGGVLNFGEDYTLVGLGHVPAGGTGTFTLNTTISSSANAFTGAFDFTGFGNYTGTIVGGFYGPATEEAGGTFTATDGGSGRATGTLVARRDPDLTAGIPGLGDITAATVFSTAASSTPGGGTAPSFDAYLTYDPATQTYAYYYDRGTTNAAEIAYRFAPGQIVAAQSDSVFTQYQGTGPAGQPTAGGTYVIRRFNHGSGNTRLALTYTSFLDVAVSSNLGPVVTTQRTFVTFGNRTPLAQMPRTGSASFAGIATGRGTYGTPGPENSTFDGTSALDANFAAGSFTSTLLLTARDTTTGVQTPLSAFSYAGAINGTGFDGRATGAGGPTGSMVGNFYGPGAAEFGAGFSYRGFDAGMLTAVQGVAVGKRP